MEKLISMTYFVLEQSKLINDPEILTRVLVQHALFLEQELNLGMFVPAKFVNGEWVILEVPKWVSPEGIKWKEYEKEYQEAKDRVIFNVHLMKGEANHLREIWNDEKYLFTYNESTKLFLTAGSTIESLVKYNLFLTESAKKQIGI